MWNLKKLQSLKLWIKSYQYCVKQKKVKILIFSQCCTALQKFADAKTIDKAVTVSIS